MAAAGDVSMIDTSNLDTTPGCAKAVQQQKQPQQQEGEPKKLQSPKVVLVSFKVNNVSDIDVVKCTFNANLSLFCHWEDPTLIGRPLGRIENHELGFDPEIMVVNGLDMVETKFHYQLELINTYTGAVKQSRHFSGRVFLLSLDLGMFPFEGQNLSINLRSKKKDFNAVALEYFSEESTVDAQPQHEWIFHGYTALSYTTLPKYSTTGKIYSSLHIVVQVQRHGGWYVNNVMVPFFALTCISWATYALQAQYQHPAAILILLISLTNKFLAGDKLASVPYRTLVDTYMDASFLCQTFSILSFILRDWYGDSSSTLYLGLFVANAGFYVFFHLHLLYRLYRHNLDVEDWKARAVVNNICDQEGQGGSKSSMSSANSIVGQPLQLLDVKYSKLGRTRNNNKLERFGLGQDIIVEEDEEGDDGDRVIVSGGKVVTKRGSDDDDDDGDDGGLEEEKGDDRSSPTRNKRLQKAYQKNLDRLHEYHETRPELKRRLKRHGLSADYAKPQLEKLLSSGALDPNRYADAGLSLDAPSSSANSSSTTNSTRKGSFSAGRSNVTNWSTGTGGTMAPQMQRAETSASILVGGGNKPTIDFEAAGHVPRT